jgi:hypothetical protein
MNKRILKKALKKAIGKKTIDKTRKLCNKGMPGCVSKLPDFVIVGAMRCGTSSLYRYLSNHSQVVPASEKEVHFFDGNFEKGEIWYRSHFPCTIRFMTRKNIITGEASPSYMFCPRVPKRMGKIVPNAKIIVLLRDPVDRAISHYWYLVKWGIEDLPMEEAFRKESERVNGKKHNSYDRKMYSYLERGNYTKQIKRMKKYFSENMIIIKSEKLFSNTQKQFDKVSDFLDIRREKVKKNVNENKSRSKKEIPRSIRNKLEKYYSHEKNKIERKFNISFG